MISAISRNPNLRCANLMKSHPQTREIKICSLRARAMHSAFRVNHTPPFVISLIKTAERFRARAKKRPPWPRVPTANARTPDPAQRVKPTREYVFFFLFFRKFLPRASKKASAMAARAHRERAHPRSRAPCKTHALICIYLFLLENSSRAIAKNQFP